MEDMRLPINPPVEPMLAKAADSIPAREDLFYEPKWDGFRCIVFRDGDEVELGSRSGKSMTRYFPEIVEAVRRSLPRRCVLDGELIIVKPGGEKQAGDRLDFDLLSQRIHPAASRVKLLAVDTPASFVAFDLLALDDESFLDSPYLRRRAMLQSFFDTVEPPLHLTPITADRDEALRWFSVFEGAGLDGLVCKSADSPYLPGKRTMTKVKHARTADVVVAGFRWHKSGPIVGSLLLGLYDATGRLQHIGVSASFTAARRKELVDELAPLRYQDDSAAGHPWSYGMGTEGDRMPGAPSRWSGTKDLSWVPLRPERVIEVAYDHMEAQDSANPRFRHTARLLRWRPDRTAQSCTYDQLDVPVRYDLGAVLASKAPI
jgi:ATP-dependent DNA ligase